jgi:hypothetical protein
MTSVDSSVFSELSKTGRCYLCYSPIVKSSNRCIEPKCLNVDRRLWDSLDDSEKERIKKAREDNNQCLRDTAKKLCVENRIQYLNEAICVLDGKYAYYSQHGSGGVMGCSHDRFKSFEEFVCKFAGIHVASDEPKPREYKPLRKCSFGKHKGLDWSQVPTEYMQWCLSKPAFGKRIHNTCLYYIRKRSVS